MNKNNKFDVSIMLENGWKQGSCLLLDKKHKNVKKGLYVVISQDCDIANPDLRKEPYVEVMYTTEIKKRSLKILIKWLINRYSRIAFPHEFNLRVRKISDQIKKVMDEYCRETLGLFIRLHPNQELSEKEKYQIEIIMLIDPGNDYESANYGFDQIISILSKVDGIEIVDPKINGVQVKPKIMLTNEISEYEVRCFDKWDFDYLSFIDGGDGEIMDEVA